MIKIGHYLKNDVLGSYSANRAASWKRRWAVARVMTFGVVVASVAAVSTAHRAKADVGEAAMILGRDLAPLADVIGETTHLDLNGEHMFVGSAVTDQPVKMVLDRFQQHCKENPGPITDLLKELAAHPNEEGRPEGSEDLSAEGFRKESDSEGTVLCLTKGALSKSSFMEAIDAFNATKNVGHLGKMRYAYAKKSKSGRTTVLTAWTEDSFNIDKLVPEDGSEPPGTDSAVVARPPSSKRMMNAQLVGTSYGVRLYASKETPEKIGEFYDADMEKKGWIKLGSKGIADVETDPTFKDTRVFVKGTQQTLIQIARDDEGEVGVQVCELGTSRGDQKELMAPVRK